MNMEEEGMEGDYIPEHSRLRGIKLTSDLQQRNGRLQYFISKRGEAGEFLIRQAEFSWWHVNSSWDSILRFPLCSNASGLLIAGILQKIE